MSATVSARQLNRATLARQLLLERHPLAATEAVRRVTALQAQEPASPYLALWNRLSGFDPAELDAAFEAHAVVKASLMRITLHAVHVDDYPHFHAAMRPTLRAARLNDRRYRDTGLTPDDADALIPRMRAFAAEPRTSAECEAQHDEPRMWWALRHYGPFWHAPTGGAWSFGARNAYVAATTRDHHDLDDAARHLIRRYLEAFGPATVADIAQWVLFPSSRARTRELLATMDLERVDGPDGVELVDVPGGEVPDADTPAPPRLLPMWDSVVLAYADRSRIVPSEHRAHAVRRNGDTLPTVLVDGYVAGVWRAREDGIEVTAFEELPADAWDGIASEAAALWELLTDRDVAVYRRYRHWWDKGIPGAEVRLLP
jgi:hypothetical protein